jgi:hypothetical protein
MPDQDATPVHDNTSSQKPAARGWAKILSYIFIAIGFLFLLGAGVILAKQVIGDALGQIPTPRATEQAIQWMLPAFVAFLLASFCWAVFEWSRDAWKLVAYQIAAFLILALSLRAFGLHQMLSAADGHATLDTEKSTAEMAAIMILFILAELAAFVGHEVTETKTEFEKVTVRASEAAKTAASASNQFKTSLGDLSRTINDIDALRQYIATISLHPDVTRDATRLLEAWRRRVPPNAPDTLDASCWRLLLSQYLQEELQDFEPQTIESDSGHSALEESVPYSVRPTIGFKPRDLSFIATNLGFYARLLEKLSLHISGALRGDDALRNSRLCIASITPVLPAHWWNFPNPDTNWRRHHVIDDYRRELSRVAADGHAQVDRVHLVYANENGAAGADRLYERLDGVLWREELLDEMLDQWQIGVYDATQRPAVIACNANYARRNGDLGKLVESTGPLPLRNALSHGTGSVYPMTTQSVNPATVTDHSHGLWSFARLRKAYSRLYGRHSSCWKLALDQEWRTSLEGRFDFLFIGFGAGTNESSPGGLWQASGVEVEWIYCLMSSMSPSSETMFLTVMSGESVQKQFSWCQKFLSDKVDWKAPMTATGAPPVPAKPLLSSRPAPAQPPP